MKPASSGAIFGAAHLEPRAFPALFVLGALHPSKLLLLAGNYAAHVVEPERRGRPLALDQSRRRGDAQFGEIGTDRDAEQIGVGDIDNGCRFER